MTEFAGIGLDRDIDKITCLAGGVGAARFLQGLVGVVPEENITVIVNTGDDFELYGLHISPDLDIVTYTLAGLVDEEKGWGINGDTFGCLGMLGRYGHETWFNLGDQDLATSINRTRLLRYGLKLSEITDLHRKQLGLKTIILPMSNDKFETYIVTDKGKLHFEEYLVKHDAPDSVLDIFFKGEDDANAAPGVIESILDAWGVIICPSNPIVSIGTILSLPGVKKALVETNACVTAISPIIGGSPVKGPADKLMRGLGFEVSSYGVAKLLRDFLDIFVIDEKDKEEKDRIESLGIKVVVAKTLMKTIKDKTSLADKVIKSMLQIKLNTSLD
jgi:LPPG:FO 2-phospho-L-lactate transferase